MARVLTFGCRLNAWESGIVERHLAAGGGKTGETLVVNTCAVTAEAERQARQAIRRLRRERPGATVVATGCAVEIDPAAWAALPEVDRIVGNRAKLEATTWGTTPPARVAGVMKESPPARVAGAMTESLPARVAGAMEEPPPAGGDAAPDAGTGRRRVRAFVRVQSGCDHRCTFCIIPFARGESRSVPAGQVVAEVRRLVAQGCLEAVLTGVDITAWGNDLPGRPRLGGLVQRILKLVPELPRLRISSMDVAEADRALLAALAEEERLLPHLHLSLQAGDAMILKRMKRRHDPGRAVAFCRAVRRLRPDAVFGADLIAGFPTEDEAMFRNTLSHVADCGLTWLHVFPYSPRPGTPAARMPQVAAALRKQRARRLRQAGEAAAQRFMAAQVGREASVLVEAPGRGRSEHGCPVAAPEAVAPASLARLRIAGLRDGRLVAAVP